MTIAAPSTGGKYKINGEWGGLQMGYKEKGPYNMAAAATVKRSPCAWSAAGTAGGR